MFFLSSRLRQVSWLDIHLGKFRSYFLFFLLGNTKNKRTSQTVCRLVFQWRSKMNGIIHRFIASMFIFDLTLSRFWSWAHFIAVSVVSLVLYWWLALLFGRWDLLYCHCRVFQFLSFTVISVVPTMVSAGKLSTCISFDRCYYTVDIVIWMELGLHNKKQTIIMISASLH